MYTFTSAPWKRLGAPTSSLQRLAPHSDEDRRLYGLAKADLARRDWPTMNDYADAKSEVIIDITNRAEDWAASTRWAL